MCSYPGTQVQRKHVANVLFAEQAVVAQRLADSEITSRMRQEVAELKLHLETRTSIALKSPGDRAEIQAGQLVFFALALFLCNAYLFIYYSLSFAR